MKKYAVHLVNATTGELYQTLKFKTPKEINKGETIVILGTGYLITDVTVMEYSEVSLTFADCREIIAIDEDKINYDDEDFEDEDEDEENDGNKWLDN